MNILILVKDVLNASKCLVISKHVSVEKYRKVLLNNQTGICSCDLLLGDMSMCKGQFTQGVFLHFTCAVFGKYSSTVDMRLGSSMFALKNTDQSDTSYMHSVCTLSMVNGH